MVGRAWVMEVAGGCPCQHTGQTVKPTNGTCPPGYFLLVQADGTQVCQSTAAAMDVPGQATPPQQALNTLYMTAWFAVPGLVVGFGAHALGAPLWLSIPLGLVAAVIIGSIIFLIEAGPIVGPGAGA